MAVYFEMQNMTTGVALDEKAFPDAAFRTLLAEAADVNGDSRLSALELRHVSELNCSNYGIADPDRHRILHGARGAQLREQQAHRARRVEKHAPE